MRTLRRYPATRLLTRCLIVAVVLGMAPELASASYATPHSVGLIHADYIGSVRRLTNEAGGISDGYTYSAFGELLAHSGTDSQPYAFTGEPLDPNSGWQYHRARWMDPRVGRFGSLDLSEGSAWHPSTLHKYAYASAHPVGAVDPSGLFVAAVSFVSAFTALTTIAQTSVPRMNALLNVVGSLRVAAIRLSEPDTPIDLPPPLFNAVPPPYGGWDLADAYNQIAEAQRVWERYGINVDAPGDVELVTASSPDVGDGSYARRVLAGAQIAAPYGTRIPVVFARSVFEGGVPAKGTTYSSDRSWRSDAVIAISDEEAEFTTLAHEIGHLLGLSHVTDPMRLMHPYGNERIDTNLSQSEFWTARTFYRHRIGAGK